MTIGFHPFNTIRLDGHSIYKARFAPTPSGFLHLGNILSFAKTAAIAGMYDAKLLLRIDDMDQQRANPLFVEDIFSTLAFLGVQWDEGPNDVQDFEKNWSQRHRLHLYNAALENLRASGALFACGCSRTEILKVSPDGHYPGTCVTLGVSPDAPGTAWRVNTGGSGGLDFLELQFSKSALSPGIYTSTLPPEVRYFVVRKKDGFAAYQLASLVDDAHFGVNLIVRGADLLPSTLAQCYLAQLLGATSFAKSLFHHHPLVTDCAGVKLSKSAGAMSVRYLREQGLPASEVLNRVAVLAGLDGAESWSELVAGLATVLL